jgi:hypothetical protein
VPEPRFGRIDPSHGLHGAYRAYLRRTIEEQFAIFLAGSGSAG